MEEVARLKGVPEGDQQTRALEHEENERPTVPRCLYYLFSGLVLRGTHEAYKLQN